MYRRYALVRPELVAALDSNDSIAAEELRDVLAMTGRLAAVGPF